MWTAFVISSCLAGVVVIGNRESVFRRLRGLFSYWACGLIALRAGADRHRAEGAACTVYLMPHDPLAEPAGVATKGKGGGKKSKDPQEEKVDTSRGNPVTVVLDDSRVQILAFQDRHSELRVLGAFRAK